MNHAERIVRTVHWQLAEYEVRDKGYASLEAYLRLCIDLKMTCREVADNLSQGDFTVSYATTNKWLNQFR